jgi:UDP-GlcNAc3NAcA epimerase
LKIFTVIGARPQFVKAAAVSREITNHPDIEEIIVHTGQHFDANMSDIFFSEMQIPAPKYKLEIHSLNHGAMTGRMLEGLEQLFTQEKPDVVLVYGDTNSTLAGALAAKKLHIKVAHVEAGLRSFNMRMPEEINRILTDRISDYLFCPTDTAIQNLDKEGYEHLPVRIFKSGDVMQDAALYYAQFAEEKAHVRKHLGISKFVLCTLHRAENTDEPSRLAGIVEGLNLVNESKKVLLPVHPRTAKILAQLEAKPQFTIIPPVGYFDMIDLLQHCDLVMTDSGGLQKEAFFFKKHCITLRDQTEWVELIDSGFNVLCDTNASHIYNTFEKMIVKQSDFDVNLYGNGEACKEIISHLKNAFTKS